MRVRGIVPFSSRCRQRLRKWCSHVVCRTHHCTRSRSPTTPAPQRPWHCHASHPTRCTACHNRVRQSATSFALPISGNPPSCHFLTCFTSRRISRIIRLVPHLTLQHPNQQIVSHRSQSMAKQPPTSTTRHLINNRCETPVTTGDFLRQSHVYLSISQIKLRVTTHNREPWLRQLPPRLPSSIESTTRL